jgi:hypothetical protein
MYCYIDQGMNGRIYQTERGVMKIQKRNSLGHDVHTQKRIHHLAETLVEELNLQLLFVPHIYLDIHDGYEMARVDTSRIIYPGDPNHSTQISEELSMSLCQDLVLLWIALFQRGFAAWDYELYLQPDGKIALLDFDKFGFCMTSGPVSIQLPQIKQDSETHVCVPDLHYFFQNPCFPYDFISRLQAHGFNPPEDCLPS